MGRFIVVLRAWAAFLAGVNQMPWRPFLFWNALGGITWAIIYGTLGFVLGNNLPLLGHVVHTIGIVGTIIAVAFILAVIVVWRRRRRLVPEGAASGASADPEP